MKLSNQLPVFAVLLITIFSCGMGSSPKKAAQNFLTSFNERDFTEARKYATPETNKLVDLMENITKMGTSTDSISHAKIEVLEEKIDGDVAMVTFKEEGSEEIQELKLKKIDGKWLVHITKEDIAAKNITDGNTDEEEGFWSDEDSLGVQGDSISIEEHSH